MKIIGKAKGKAPKAWCLMKNTETGHYYVGWDGNWPLNGGHESVNASAKASRDALGPKPERGEEVKWPGFHIHGRSSHANPLTQEQLDQYEEYTESQARAYAENQWLKSQEIGQIEGLDYVPVFQSGLRFMGYTRGRSSVTMKFEADNGQELEFGPSGIDGLIRGIIEGVCIPVELEGTFEDQQWDSDKREHFYTTKPRGKGILATFKFVKKGANTYAELTEL